VLGNSTTPPPPESDLPYHGDRGAALTLVRLVPSCAVMRSSPRPAGSLVARERILSGPSAQGSYGARATVACVKVLVDASGRGTLRALLSRSLGMCSAVSRDDACSDELERSERVLPYRFEEYTFPSAILNVSISLRDDADLLSSLRA
jgi:hypothetical protein